MTLFLDKDTVKMYNYDIILWHLSGICILKERFVSPSNARE